MDAPELDEVRRQLAAGELGPARDLLDTLAADHLAAGREARAAGCLQLSATVSRLSGDRQGAIERAERAASLSVSGSDVGARIDAERHAIATELGVLAIAEALEQGGLEAVAREAEHTRDAALIARLPGAYRQAMLALSSLAAHQDRDADAYGYLATAWVTLGDLGGRDVGRALVEPALVELQTRWGTERFDDARRAYEAQRRATLGNEAR